MKKNGWKMIKKYDNYKKDGRKRIWFFINKFIKDFFDWQNKYLERNKEAIKNILEHQTTNHLLGGMSINI